MVEKLLTENMKSLLKLALPTSAMYFGLMLMGLVDMLFVGRLGAAPLGGLGLGNSIFSWVMVIGIGMLFGLDYPASHAMGAGNRAKAFRVFAQGMHLAWAFAIPSIVATIGIALALHRFGLNPEVVPTARRFLILTAVSYLPIFMFNAGRSYLQAQSVAVPTFVILVLANCLNAFLDAALIGGRFGFHSIGFDGACVATVSSRFFMALSMFGYVFYRELKVRGGFSLDFTPSRELIDEIARLGMPSAAQMLLEVGVFSLATALAAKFSAIDLAAHQVVLNTASLLFMVPLGVSSATGSLVGQRIGAGDLAGGRKIGNSALLLGLGFALFSSTLLILFADSVLGIYSKDVAVIKSAKRLLFVAALFQISDGAQVIATGALRGVGNTLSAAIANGVGHWLIGLPIGLMLGFTMGRGVLGIWIGLATGLTFVAGSLLFAWFRTRGATQTIGDRVGDAV